MAHRVAIDFTRDECQRHGVFIPRRDTGDPLFALLGGRLFPGYARRSQFEVNETRDSLTMDVHTEGGRADLHVRVTWPAPWHESAVFDSCGEASDFFREAPCGFNWRRDGRGLEGMELETAMWHVQPVQVHDVDAQYFNDRRYFPPGSVEFDHALLMRNIPHRWHAVNGAAVRDRLRPVA
jgi:hypothetical protein